MTRGALGLIALALVLGLSQVSRGAVVAYWTFNDGADTTAADSSGNNHHGTLSGVGTGAAPTWDSNGRFGNSLEFNTPNTTVGGNTNGSLVTVPFDAAFRLNGAFTVSFWWRPDSDFTSGFPGAMRIGSQSATTGSTIGWGFFHGSTESPVFKRGNVQPAMANPAVSMTIGDWHQITLTYDGAGNNIAVQDGVARTFSQTWLAATSSANFEIGRMDQFLNAGLDDIGIFDNAVTVGQARSVYTTPTSLELPYSLAEMQLLWQIHETGAGASGQVGGRSWSYTDSLPGSFTVGDSYVDGGNFYIALTSTTGLTAVPEPASATLIAAAGMLYLGRRRRSARRPS